MTSSEEKYPANQWLFEHPSMRIFDGGLLDCKLSLEFNQLLEENRQQAAKIDRYERALKDISDKASVRFYATAAQKSLEEMLKRVNYADKVAEQALNNED